jgi:hypothetical protein
VVFCKILMASNGLKSVGTVVGTPWREFHLSAAYLKVVWYSMLASLNPNIKLPDINWTPFVSYKLIVQSSST